MSYILEYLNEIEKGKINAPKTIIKAYKKFIPIIDGKSEDWEYNEKRGRKPSAFIERFCKHSKGKWAGKPLSLMLFQKAKYEAMYGFLSRADGTRKFKINFDMRGRKNGKTTELAGIGIYSMVGDGEKGAEIYSLATMREQAKRTWEESRTMVAQSSTLQAFLKNRSYDIYCNDTFSTFKALGKNTNNFDGLNCSVAILDEIHAIKDRNTYDVIKQSQSARRQPLLYMITTAGTDRAGLFDDMYDYAINVLNGVIEDERFFPLLYTLDNPELWTDEASWQQANPAIDVIKNRQELMEKVESAKQFAPNKPDVMTKDFNIIGVTRKGWLPYESCHNPNTFDILKFRNHNAIGGFDLSRTGDLTAFNTMFWDNNKGEYCCETMYWLPENKLKENSPMQTSYRAWVDRGLLRTCPGGTIDYRMIVDYVCKEMVNELGIIYNWIYYDSYSATYLVNELESEGFAKDYCMVLTIQGFKTLSVPMQFMEEQLKQKHINYNNNPVTLWCLTNVELVQDRNGNYMPKKYDDKHDRKIDGMAVILDCFVGVVDHIAEFKELC